MNDYLISIINNFRSYDNAGIFQYMMCEPLIPNVEECNSCSES